MPAKACDSACATIRWPASGLYIPGGKASYPSSVLMNAIPAQVAGVERIVVVTPPQALEENPLVAAALDLLGIGEVYRVGGAQAIAALAYGTESIRSVDKIVGPGNAYVQAAKRMVYGTVDIDMTAGPSEVAIVADESCDPAWIAADLLAQAEHDEMAGVWLVCWSESLAAAVFDEVQVQLASLERNAIARVAIEKRGIVFLVAESGRCHRPRQRDCGRTRGSADGRTRSRRRWDSQCGRAFHRSLCSDRRRRLLRRTEPRVAHGTHRAFLLASRCSGFHEAHERDSILRPSRRTFWTDD